MDYFYFDTCAIVKLFIEAEKGCQAAKDIYDAPENHIITNELSNLEFISALKRKLNNREITSTQFEDAKRLFAQRFTVCVDTGKVMFLTIDSEVYVNAIHLIMDHDLRTLDAIQLQTIMPYAGLNPTFVTSDNKLAAAASNYFNVCNLNEEQ